MEAILDPTQAYLQEYTAGSDVDASQALLSYYSRIADRIPVLRYWVGRSEGYEQRWMYILHSNVHHVYGYDAYYTYM